MKDSISKSAASERRSYTLSALIVAGSLLFVAASILSSFHVGSMGLVAVRWAALILLALAGLRKPSLTFWILFAMLLGGEIGADRPAFAEHLRFLSDIFLRLIQVIVAPLILGSLISGIAGHADLRGLGRISIKTLVYFEIVTTLALLIGVAAIDISRAGEGLAIAQPDASAPAAIAAPIHWDDFLVHVFPENLAKSVADGEILQIAVFAVLLGIALSRVPEPSRAPILNFCKSLTQAMFKFTNIVMYFAPLAVGAAMAYTVGHTGVRALLPLSKLLLTAYGAFFFFILAVLSPIAVLARLPLRRFLDAVAEPTSIAFATSASGAALPLAMENMETFGVPREIVAFVIPAGYSFNMDGATIYLALASIFVAQAAGMHLSWTTQLVMVFTFMLTSKGLAGVPRAVLVILVATAATFHLPTGPILVLLGIDALIDMGRAAINVLGNCLASAVVARWEGELQVDKAGERPAHIFDA
jgi:proton glutamate symport protein